MMKTSEFKLRMIKVADELIDVYFGEDNFVDKIVNSSLKVMLNTNSDKLDEMINTFSKNGEIDAETIVHSYADNIGNDGVTFNIKDFVKSDFIRGFLPDKSLIITKEDVLKVLPLNEICS